MRVLIAGMGYAGSRFLTAFRSLTATGDLDQPLEIAYHARHRTRDDIPYFASLPQALTTWRPEIVVVAVTDSAHAEILYALNGYTGFVIAEKPLAAAGDDLPRIEDSLRLTSGFSMDLVERYSDVTHRLREYVREHSLTLVRANFTWGKDRINDHRPTVGVASEVVHSLDLMQWIAGAGAPLEVRHAIGTTSDFSVSGPAVLDSVALTAHLGEAVITGYSSFTSIVRRRTLDFTFRTRHTARPELVHARAVYDTPVWDADQLRVWRRTDGQDETLLEIDTSDTPTPEGLRAVVKLRRLALDAVRYAAHGTAPGIPFAGIGESVALQRTLNAIEQQVETTGPATYFPAGRTPLAEVDWERLG
ncbi:Gfo/Idh/MocA family oxidoreductase [Streptomyces flavidovirens]|uniref:Gfo/Idh/MocA family oxidoreductase n=1 Tax=Streptomyces flavidovirens TaxID=67298 RepID=UPI003675DC6F